MGAPDLDLTDFALWQCFAVRGIGDFQRDIWQGEPDGTGAAISIVGFRGVHVGFSHAVPIEVSVPGARLKRDMGVRDRGTEPDTKSRIWVTSAWVNRSSAMRRV